ncbi:MAG TPA: IS4 family transposase [Flavisolibacter sp.]
MHSGKYVFAQVTDFLPVNDFNKCVKKYNGSYKVHHFTCWHQLLAMVFGQIANRESLSDLVLCLRSQKSKWYHLGLGMGLSKSNLAYANENRNWQIFADFAYLLIAQARRTCNHNDFDVDVAGNVYAIDSTTIDLCLSVFWWAPFRKSKAAVKVHTQFDVKTQVPTFILISDGLLHDVNILDSIEFEPGAFYIMDKAYIDFARLYRIHKSNSFFVLRLQVNQDFRRVYSHKVDKTSGVIVDQTIKLNNFYPAKRYPEKLRRIKYYDKETNLTLEFFTNNFELQATEIATLYKHRWSVELFFKWIKQHLKIKTFWGHSENAVRIQVYSAIIAYVSVVIMKNKCRIKHSPYEILQILSITLLNKTPLNELFKESYPQTIKELNDNQLIMF